MFRTQRNHFIMPSSLCLINEHFGKADLHGSLDHRDQSNKHNDDDHQSDTDQS